MKTLAFALLLVPCLLAQTSDPCSPGTEPPLCLNEPDVAITAPCLLAPPTCRKGQRPKPGVCSAPTHEPCNYF